MTLPETSTKLYQKKKKKQEYVHCFQNYSKTWSWILLLFTKRSPQNQVNSKGEILLQKATCPSSTKALIVAVRRQRWYALSISASRSNSGSSGGGKRWNSPSLRDTQGLPWVLGTLLPKPRGGGASATVISTRMLKEVFEGRPSLSLSLSPTEPQVSPTLPMSGMATHVETNSSLSLNLSAFDFLQKKCPPPSTAPNASWLAESSQSTLTFLPPSKSTEGVH